MFAYPLARLLACLLGWLVGWLTCEARAVEHQKLNQTTPRRRLVEFLVFNLLALACLLLDLLGWLVCLLALLGFFDLLGFF